MWHGNSPHQQQPTPPSLRTSQHNAEPTHRIVNPLHIPTLFLLANTLFLLHPGKTIDMWPGQPDRPQFSASFNTESYSSQRSYIPACLPRTAPFNRADRNRVVRPSVGLPIGTATHRVSHPAIHHHTALRCLSRTSPTGAKTPRSRCISLHRPPTSHTRVPCLHRHDSCAPFIHRRRYYCV